MGRSATVTRGLIEREEELHRIGAVVAGAGSGHGGLLLIEGDPGIGKTALLRALEQRAREDALAVLAASGGQLERDFPHGIVRQLYERLVRGLPTARRRRLLSGAAALAGPVVQGDAPRLDSAAPHLSDAAAAVNHGLYWLTVGLADSQPLVLLIDDAHWADSASLVFLHYLGRRIEDLPILVALAIRPAEPTTSPESMRGLRTSPNLAYMVPAPLSDMGTTNLIVQTLGRPPGNAFVRSCRKATGGNPYLLGELLCALAVEGVEPTDAAAEHVEQLGPRSIALNVLGRLATLGPEAVALGQAVAVLGSEASLHHAATLAGLAPAAAQGTADGLVDARILAPGRPLRFAHPIVRHAIYENLPTGRRFGDHARAARLLDASGEDDRAAIQLLATEPTGDPWVVSRLRASGARALAQGAPDQATALLRRALEEPPRAHDRLGVLMELGQAELLVGDPVAVDHLRRALAMTKDPRLRAAIAARFSGAAAPGEGVGEAARVLEAVLAELPRSERDLVHLLEGHLVALSVLHRSLIHKAWARLDRFHPAELDDRPGDRVLLAWLAGRSMLRGDCASQALSVARRALAGGRLLTEQLGHSQHYTIAAATIGFSDGLREAHANFSEAIEDSRRRGSETGFAIGSCFRSWWSLRLGHLAAAEADAKRAVELAEQSPLLASIVHYALCPLVETLVLRGQLDEAERELQRASLDLEEPEQAEASLVIHARGVLKLCRCEPAAALDDFQRAGRMSLEWGFSNPAWLPWRSNAALAHQALGERGDALALAREELELARRFGSRVAVGVALRGLGLVTERKWAIDVLQEAVSTLEQTQATLEHGRSLVDLGSALRAGNRSVEARVPLGHGMDIAQRCGAVRLARRAREELRATGARPRRLVQTGVDSLTASERRVAQMAAENLSNPEIAQALYVTRKTVETHLGHVYRKLGIDSRQQLAQRLADGSVTSPISVEDPSW